MFQSSPSRQKDNDAGTPPVTAPGLRIVEDFNERWRFPSDHLPVAAEVEGLRLASWNVLNTRWTEFFGANHEGLARSAIMTEHAVMLESGWTKRDEHVLQLISELSSRVDLLLLQECSAALLRRLLRRLPRERQLLQGSIETRENDIAAVYDTGRLVLDQPASNFFADGFPCKPGKAIMDMFFKVNARKQLRIINTHVPGDPKLPGLQELAVFLQRTLRADIPTAVAGDLNFTPSEIKAAFEKASLEDFSTPVLTNTNIGTGKIIKQTDHILVFFEETAPAPLSPVELSDEVAQAAKLLNP